MIIGLIGGALLVFAGAAIVFQIAGDRGRDGSAWAALDIAVASGVGWLVYAAIMTADEVTLWMGFVALIAVCAAHVVVCTLVIKLGHPDVDARGSSFELDVLGQREPETARLELTVSGLAIHRGEHRVEIGFVDLVEARADVETLALRWRSGDEIESLRLLPRLEHRGGRIKLSERLARRIDAAR